MQTAEVVRNFEEIQVDKNSAQQTPLLDKTMQVPESVMPKKKKKNSLKGDSLFVSLLGAFAALMGASFKGMIPEQSWELMTLSEHLAWANWLIKNAWFPIVLSILYVVLCFYGENRMKSHKGFDKELRSPLAWWSVLLATFSILGALRTVPMVYKIATERGVMHLVCGDTRYEWLEGSAGFWTFWFCMSKVPELLDTAFIVLRKKELITLHWYHHFTVMLFCWQAWATCTLNGLIFAAMNLTVHSVMYTFYALTAFGYRPTTFAIFITLGQILQMVVGTWVTAYVTIDKLIWHPISNWDFSLKVPAYFFHKDQSPDGGECHVSSGNALAGLIMYGSYLAFFCKFFYDAYIAKGAKGE